jgi:DNA-binding response OmpR family regulator
MKRILVIDDKPEVRSVVTMMLTQYCFFTLQAGTGREGVQLALDHHPDLILCDVSMPDMNGYETLAAIRAIPSIMATPFIFMAGCVDDRRDFRRGMACGADDYLYKPFRPDELVEAVTSRLVRQTELQYEAFTRAEALHAPLVQLSH